MRFVGRNSTNFAELTGQGGRVSTVAIAFGESNDAAVRWDLAIDATTQERGTIRVGRILTTPPAWFDGLPGAVAQRASTRIVAIASCADATSWKVTGRPVVAADGSDAPVASSIADCTLTAINIPLASDGVTPVNADAIGIERPVGLTDRVAVAAQPAPPTLVVPYDADRARVVIAAGSAGDLLLGFDPTAANTYFTVPAGVAFESSTHRPIWASSVAGVTATFWVERY